MSASGTSAGHGGSDGRGGDCHLRDHLEECGLCRVLPPAVRRLQQAGEPPGGTARPPHGVAFTCSQHAMGSSGSVHQAFLTHCVPRSFCLLSPSLSYSLSLLPFLPFSFCLPSLPVSYISSPLLLTPSHSLSLPINLSPPPSIFFPLSPSLAHHLSLSSSVLCSLSLSLSLSPSFSPFPAPLLPRCPQPYHLLCLGLLTITVQPQRPNLLSFDAQNKAGLL